MSGHCPSPALLKKKKTPGRAQPPCVYFQQALSAGRRHFPWKRMGGGLALGPASACWAPSCRPVRLLWGRDHPILYAGRWGVCPGPGLRSVQGQKVDGDASKEGCWSLGSPSTPLPASPWLCPSRSNRYNLALKPPLPSSVGNPSSGCQLHLPTRVPHSALLLGLRLEGTRKGTAGSGESRVR